MAEPVVSGAALLPRRCHARRHRAGSSGTRRDVTIGA
jgi:hypothetical protein